MFKAIQHRILTRLFKIIRHLEEKERSRRLDRDRVSILIFFHGFDSASVHRALVVGTMLRCRGYPVEFAGTGSFAAQFRQEDFPLHDLATPIQDLGAVLDFGTNEADYDSFIAQSVEAERALMGRLKPDLAIVDSRPTLRLAAALEGVDVVWMTSAYTMPEYADPIHLPEFVRTWDSIIKRTTHQEWTHGAIFGEMYLLCDIPAVHPLGPEMPVNYSFVGPLLEGFDAEEQDDVEREGVYWDLRMLEADWPSIQEAVQKLGMKGIRQWVVSPVGVSIDPIERCEIVDPSFLRQAASQAAVFAGGGDHGFFYQALFKGIPVIGLPTNCTQEYFIDRLQALGLGIKLSYRDFTRATSLVQSAEGLLNQYAIFARRCRAFAADIQEWQGANRVADIIDEYWMSRTAKSRLDPDYQMSQRDFARQFQCYNGVTSGFQYCLPRLEYVQDPRGGLPWEDVPGAVAHIIRTHPEKFRVTETMIQSDFAALDPLAQEGGYPFPELKLMQDQVQVLFDQVPDSPIGWISFYPHNASAPRVALEAIGGFDEEMFHSEGWDLAYRLILPLYGRTP